MTTIPVLQPLERMGSPLAAEDLREAKKDRHKRDSPFDLDGSDAREMDTDGLPATGLVESDSPELLLGEDSERPELAARASYASVVHDASMYNKQAEDVLDLTLDKPDTTDVPIANKEPGELFGPWMTVDNRRRRPLNKSSSGRNKALMDSMAEGSRFAILESVVPEVTPTIVADTEVPPSSNVIARKASGPSSSSTVGAELPHGVRKNAAYLASNPPRKSKAVVSPVSHPEVLSMVSGQPVVVVEHRPPKDLLNHRDVALMEHGHGKETSGVVAGGNGRGFKVRSAKENHKPGLMVRKPSQAKTINRPVLTDWVDNVQAQLDTIAKHKETTPAGTLKVVINHDGFLEVQPLVPGAHKEDGLPAVSSLDDEGGDAVMDQ
ncbi:hypothetical protein V6N11_039789 [Hibiscus sabdariffa]|uniref:Uncharacterized protein n=1 Tax=Hibiscus sabdariffa TaxID=183260 RepID=A0ABR2RFX7_9ROSI